MKIWIASDHAGFDLKTAIQTAYKTRRPEIEWHDLGPTNADRVDYPDFADLVTEKVAAGEGIGVLVCGSGQGMAMRANRHPGIRAALAYSEDSARLSREHNDANILCLAARAIDSDFAVRLLDTFLNTRFEGGRHAERVRKIDRPVK